MKNLQCKLKIVYRLTNNYVNNLWPIKKIRSAIANRNQLHFDRKIVGINKKVFDVGANLGIKTDIFLKLGCKIVAVEPQADYAGYLRTKYLGNDRVIVEQYGLGKQDGEATINISTKYPGFSSMNQDWQKGTKYHSFDKTEKVHITTLDNLIKRHGVPDFCKIDVEGFEAEVLTGLSTKIPLLNFEFHSDMEDLTKRCLNILHKLGYNEFNFVEGEKSRLTLRNWVPQNELWPKIKRLETHKKTMVWGDIYAK